MFVLNCADAKNNNQMAKTTYSDNLDPEKKFLINIDQSIKNLKDRCKQLIKDISFIDTTNNTRQKKIINYTFLENIVCRWIDQLTRKTQLYEQAGDNPVIQEFTIQKLINKKQFNRPVSDKKVDQKCESNTTKTEQDDEQVDQACESNTTKTEQVIGDLEKENIPTPSIPTMKELKNKILPKILLFLMNPSENSILPLVPLMIKWTSKELEGTIYSQYFNTEIFISIFNSILDIMHLFKTSNIDISLFFKLLNDMQNEEPKLQVMLHMLKVAINFLLNLKGDQKSFVKTVFYQLLNYGLPLTYDEKPITIMENINNSQDTELFEFIINNVSKDDQTLFCQLMSNFGIRASLEELQVKDIFQKYNNDNEFTDYINKSFKNLKSKISIGKIDNNLVNTGKKIFHYINNIQKGNTQIKKPDIDLIPELSLLYMVFNRSVLNTIKTIQKNAHNTKILLKDIILIEISYDDNIQYITSNFPTKEPESISLTQYAKNVLMRSFLNTQVVHMKQKSDNDEKLFCDDNNKGYSLLNKISAINISKEDMKLYYRGKSLDDTTIKHFMKNCAPVKFKNKVSISNISVMDLLAKCIPAKFLQRLFMQIYQRDDNTSAIKSILHFFDNDNIHNNYDCEEKEHMENLEDTCFHSLFLDLIYARNNYYNNYKNISYILFSMKDIDSFMVRILTSHGSIEQYLKNKQAEYNTLYNLTDEGLLDILQGNLFDILNKNNDCYDSIMGYKTNKNIEKQEPMCTNDRFNYQDTFMSKNMKCNQKEETSQEINIQQKRIIISGVVMTLGLFTVHRTIKKNKENRQRDNMIIKKETDIKMTRPRDTLRIDTSKYTAV